MSVSPSEGSSQLTVSYLALQCVWAVLGESGISVKSVVAVLSFFVLAGKSKVASGHQRVNSLCAASVYLLLLRTPGKES